MRFGNRDQPVHALATTNCADESLAQRIRHRVRGGDFNTLIPTLVIDSSRFLEKMLSRSWIRSGSFSRSRLPRATAVASGLPSGELSRSNGPPPGDTALYRVCSAANQDFFGPYLGIVKTVCVNNVAPVNSFAGRMSVVYRCPGCLNDSA